MPPIAQPAARRVVKTVGSPLQGLDLAIFPSGLGWMVLVGSGLVVRHLSFGHATARAALAAVPRDLAKHARQTEQLPALAGRLQAYASGARDDFADVAVELDPTSTFRRRVIDECRKIPYGQTVTYAELAARAGSPRAARAVGNCMAANPVPLVIPCHRVVGSSHMLGGYSAVGGVATKRMLLELEAGRAAEQANRSRSRD